MATKPPSPCRAEVHSSTTPAEASSLPLPGFRAFVSMIDASPHQSHNEIFPHWTVSPVEFLAPPLRHPDLRLSMVEFHSINGIKQVLVTDRQIKTLHVLLPVPVPDYHVRNGGVDTATHRVCLATMAKIVHCRPWIEPTGLHCVTPSPSQRILMWDPAFVVEKDSFVVRWIPGPFLLQNRSQELVNRDPLPRRSLV